MKTVNVVLVAIVLMFSQGIYAQNFKVNPEKSNIEWLGKKLTGEHTGNILLKSGSFELKNDKIVSGNFVVDMNSITCTDIEDKSYNQKLVGHLKSDDFFGVEKFPTANFVISKAEKFVKGKAKVDGMITIKGKTEKISFVVNKKGNQFSSKVEIDRAKFNVKYGSDSFFDNLGDKVIDDIFVLDIVLAVK